jgi:hypothetical protein
MPPKTTRYTTWNTLKIVIVICKTYVVVETHSDVRVICHRDSIENVWAVY